MFIFSSQAIVSTHLTNVHRKISFFITVLQNFSMLFCSKMKTSEQRKADTWPFCPMTRMKPENTDKKSCLFVENFGTKYR